MPRSFLIKNKKQQEKPEKSPPPTESACTSDSPHSPVTAEDPRRTVDSCSPTGELCPKVETLVTTDTPLTPGDMEEEEYLDVESMDTDDEMPVNGM